MERKLACPEEVRLEPYGPIPQNLARSLHFAITVKVVRGNKSTHERMSTKKSTCSVNSRHVGNTTIGGQVFLAGCRQEMNDNLFFRTMISVDIRLSSSLFYSDRNRLPSKSSKLHQNTNWITVTVTVTYLRTQGRKMAGTSGVSLKAAGSMAASMHSWKKVACEPAQSKSTSTSHR